MKIDRVETLVVFAESRNWIFVKVSTDQGLSGWGEATLEWKTRAVVGAVEDLAPLLVGRDLPSTAAVGAIRDEIEVRGYYPLGIVSGTALSGVEQALWDLRGQAEGVPVFELLGGAKREHVPAYLNLEGGESAANGFEPDPAILEIEAAKAATARFPAVKAKPIPPGFTGESGKAIALVKRLRAALGSGVGLALDLHGRTSAAGAVALGRALGEEKVLFLEEPCPAEDFRGLAEIRGSIPIPLASGERLTGRLAFEEIFRRRACDVVQPDVCHCGGLLEAKRISERAASCGMTVAPHNPLGPIATAASVHLAFAIPSLLLQEVRLADAPWRDEIVDAVVRPVNGRFERPARPGLGVAIRESEARRHPFREVLPPRPVGPGGDVLAW